MNIDTALQEEKNKKERIIKNKEEDKKILLKANDKIDQKENKISQKKKHSFSKFLKGVIYTILIIVLLIVIFSISLYILKIIDFEIPINVPFFNEFLENNFANIKELCK